MSQANLSKWLKLILLGMGICGLAVYLVVVPSFGDSIRSQYPEFASRYWPWLIFIWVSGIPCYAVLVLGWRIAANIGRDASFSLENARFLRSIAVLAALDAAYVFLGNLAMLFLDMSHPGVVLLSLLVVFAGAAVAVAAGALSHLVRKAALLQEENDLTI